MSDTLSPLAIILITLSVGAIGFHIWVLRIWAKDRADKKVKDATPQPAEGA